MTQIRPKMGLIMAVSCDQRQVSRLRGFTGAFWLMPFFYLGGRGGVMVCADSPVVSNICADVDSWIRLNRVLVLAPPPKQ